MLEKVRLSKHAWKFVLQLAAFWVWVTHGPSKYFCDLLFLVVYSISRATSNKIPQAAFGYSWTRAWRQSRYFPLKDRARTGNTYCDCNCHCNSRLATCLLADTCSHASHRVHESFLCRNITVQKDVMRMQHVPCRACLMRAFPYALYKFTVMNFLRTIKV